MPKDVGLSVGRESKRKRPQSRRKRSRLPEVLGAAGATVGVLALVCLCFEPRGPVRGAGAVGTRVAQALELVSGNWAPVIPGAIVALGIVVALERTRAGTCARSVGIVSVAVALLGFVRAGLVGTQLQAWLSWALGPTGAGVVLGFVFAVGVSLAIDIPLPVLVFACLRSMISGARLCVRGVRLCLGALSFLASRVLLPLFEEAEKENEAAVELPTGTVGERPAYEAAAGRLGRRCRTSQPPASHARERAEDLGAVPWQKGAQVSSSGYALPPITLLGYPARPSRSKQPNGLDQARLLEETLASFGVKGKVAQVDRGPVVTRYELAPPPGVKVSKIMSLADDIALALASSGVRLEAPIPGKSAIGIEVPNQEIALVYLREVLQSSEFQRHRSKLAIALGKDIAGKSVVADLVSMLHVLVAGATGSGKSVCLNTLIASLLFKATPEDVKLLMIDPKRVELTTYDGIPHLLAPVVTDTKEAGGYLRWIAEEMDNRYKLLEASGVRNIERYNTLCRAGRVAEDGAEPLPYIVVIIDELGDLMMVAQRDVEDVVSQLAFMARAAGIHLVVATQRPSADVVTGIIKMNIPSRVAFAVPSQVDSRVILDTSGAERLLGRGDMLFFPVGAPKPVRVQGAFVSDSEIEAVVDFVRSQAEPTYIAHSVTRQSTDGESLGEEDPLFEEAVRLILETEEASISKLQRRFRIGYTRAARLIDAMEARGMVGPYEGSRPRKVLMNLDKWEAVRGKSRESGKNRET